MINKLLMVMCLTLCTYAYASENSVDVNGYIMDDSPVSSEEDLGVASVNSQPVVQPTKITPKMPEAAPIIVKEIEYTQDWTYSIKDKYVSMTFAKWAKSAGYQLIWQASSDFEIQSSGVISSATFKNAVNDVLRSFKYTDSPLKAEWYQNNVVVITDF
ncbi:MAG: TcpQ domain-containing protein [Burkholderiales bacterium]|nr:TcpQ domain-containing protein [Burkholderiales bacterium]